MLSHTHNGPISASLIHNQYQALIHSRQPEWVGSFADWGKGLWGRVGELQAGYHSLQLQVLL